MVTTATPSPNVVETSVTEKKAKLMLISRLEKVISSNKIKICQVWYRRLMETWPESKLFLKQKKLLNTLLPGMQDFVLKNQDIFSFNMVLDSISKQFSHIIQDDHENNRVLLANQVKTAINYFQDAVDSILKFQNIPPHWIFALDSFIQQGVEAAIQVFYKSKQMFKVDKLDSMTTTPDTAHLSCDMSTFHRQNSCFSATDQTNADESFYSCLPTCSSDMRSEIMFQVLQDNTQAFKKVTEVLNLFCDRFKYDIASRPSTVDSNTVRNLTAYQDLIQLLNSKDISQNTINSVSQFVNAISSRCSNPTIYLTVDQSRHYVIASVEQSHTRGSPEVGPDIGRGVASLECNRRSPES